MSSNIAAVSLRQADEDAVEAYLEEEERLQTPDPETGETPKQFHFDAEDFPEIEAANEAVKEYLIDEGEWDHESEGELQALDEDTTSATADPAEQSEQPASEQEPGQASPEQQSAPAVADDEDVYEVSRYAGQMYTPDLETILGPEYRGFNPTAGRDLGYTPFEFLSFKGDETCEIDHHRVVQVDAPIAKCWKCWADRLNYCEWFDLINQVGFILSSPEQCSISISIA